MERLIQIAVVGVIAALLTTLLKKTSKALALALSLTACVLISLVLVELAKPLVEFLSRLRKLAELDKILLEPLLKTIGIGLLTQLCATVCSDAGENAIANLIELCGGVLALYVSLPLFEAVLDTVQKIAGGAR